LDEPLSALDLKLRQHMRTEFRRRFGIIALKDDDTWVIVIIIVQPDDNGSTCFFSDFFL